LKKIQKRKEEFEVNSAMFYRERMESMHEKKG
jgi:hypothetical protein